MHKNTLISKFCGGAIAILIVLGALLGLGDPAAAHPLGNFTINHFSRLEVGSPRVTVHYVVDMAEIPTFQTLQEVDTDGDGAFSADELKTYLERVIPIYGSGLHLAIDDLPVSLQPGKREISLPPGAGGLPTLRIESDFSGAIPPQANFTWHQLHFEDTNDLHRLGWREIAIAPAAGMSVFNSSAYGNSVTDELKAYPQDLLAMPLNERIAELSFTSSEMPAGANPLLNREGSPVRRDRDRLAELIAMPEVTPMLVIVSLLVATGLGGFHALSPGHGKTLVGTYLIGARATAWQAAFLGLSVTITHTIGVFALGLVTLVASQYFLPEQMFPILSLVSGGIAILLGLGLFIRRLQGLFAHARTHHHRHSHTHPHPTADAGSWQNLIALGVSGGLLPCPSALVVFLSAVSLHRIGFGLLLVIAFSLGLAGTLTTIGLAFIYARNLIERLEVSRRWGSVLSVLSPLVTAAIGALLCYREIIGNW
jgi:ABC-type nickel/cobalt efflux system permease component RcnA